MTAWRTMLSALVPRRGLYCVWIRAHDRQDAPLIRVWIDPSMSMFESRAKLHEPDLAAARVQTSAPVSEDH
jgi:hypothetical protein